MSLVRMEDQATVMDHPKRRRRRRKADRQPISAWLAFTENIKGDIGVLSDDLYSDLFNRHPSRDELDHGSSTLLHVAISPWSPLSPDLAIDAKWTILPVTAQNPDVDEASRLPPSSIRFSASSLALQSYSQTFLANPSVRGVFKGRQGFEIRALDVEPITLDTIYITVDGIALQKHDEIQKRFGGGFGAHINGFGNKDKGKGKSRAFPHEEEVNGSSATSPAQDQEIRLIAAIREAFPSSRVVRQGGLLPLPLPTHPITHAPFPPSKITLAEPVSQGLLSPNTKIVVNRVFHQDHASRTLTGQTNRRPFQRAIVEEDDDTSNEQFFSAVEDDNHSQKAVSQRDDLISDSDSSEKDAGSLSDDSLENMISMSTPDLPTLSSGALSSMTATTSRPGMPESNDVSTPGSMFSNLTATTARQGSAGSGKTFQVKGLLSKISDDILHPKPASDEDEDARVFVDVRMLVKLGCFSGDWIKVEAVPATPMSQQRHWGIEAFGHVDIEPVEFRALKVYGIADSSPNATTQYLKSNVLNRRSSVAALASRPKPTAWLSPILLASIGQPNLLRLSPLSNTARKSSFRTMNDRGGASKVLAPPIAKEVTLHRISTPLSTERTMQMGIFTALKQRFEYKRRILRQGDFVALGIDTGASRLFNKNSMSQDTDRETEELLNGSQDGRLGQASSLGVAWFRVGEVLLPAPNEDQHSTDQNKWGGVACIEPMNTRMVQAGSEQSKVPATLENTWEYYLSMKSAPISQLSLGRLAESTADLPKPYVMPLRRRLRALIAAATSPRAVRLSMDPMVILLYSTQRNIGKATLASRACWDLGVHVFPIDAYDILSEDGAGGAEMKAEVSLKSRAERAMSCGPEYTALLIRHIEALTGDRMVSALKELVQRVRVLVATTTDIDSISDGIRSAFTHELEYFAPDEGEREGTLREIVEERNLRLANDVDLGAIAIKSAALVAGDLVDIVERAAIARQYRLDNLVKRNTHGDSHSAQILIRDLLVAGGENARCVTKSDFDIAVDAARKNFADAIGAPKIPNVSWDDVGGLENVKDAVMETIQLPLERPELFAKGMKKRSGILFYGPPGTGKTLLAKAIATEFSLNFFSVKGPELLNMYIGESEANVRRVFQRARDARPCVVFFDELDSVAPKRGNQGDSGGVMDRIVSQLLAELDGMSDGDEGAGGVFVIGATNRPDLLDQALLRPGRFDKMLYLGVSDTHDKQLTILEALTRKFNMHPDVSLRRVAQSLPFTYTGADLYALCSDAMLKAITRQASAVDAKIRALPNGPVTTAYFFDHLATPDDVAVMVTEADFSAAQRELVGSVR